MKEQFHPPIPSSSNPSPTLEPEVGEYFDYVEKEIDEDLICSICLLPFIDPISHNSDECGNTFCSKCVENVANCPMCRQVDFKKNCSSAKTIGKLLDKLKVKCGMCKNIVLRGELKVHQEKYCPLHEAYEKVEELKKKLEVEFQEKSEKLEREHQEIVMKTTAQLGMMEEELKGKYEERNHLLEKRMKELELEFREKKDNSQREYEGLMNSFKMESEIHLKEANQHLEMKERELLKQYKEKEELLLEKIMQVESQISTREKIEASNKPIHLNVRGSIVTVALGDFIHSEREPDNLFKKMFTGQYPCYQTSSKQFNDPIYFIDCDPILFRHVLEWLKFGFIPSDLTNDMKQCLLNASEIFGLEEFSKKLNYTEKNSKYQLSQIEFMNMRNSARDTNTVLNLSGFDLRKLSLRNEYLMSSRIIESDFSGMNLKDTNFQFSQLNGCNFSNCNLTGVNFQGCHLEDCDFTNAILFETDLSNTNLANANFENAKYQGTRFVGSKFDNPKGFSNCNLSEIDFSKSYFNKVNFANSDLSNSNFSEANFTACNIENTNLTKTKFTTCEFFGCKVNRNCTFLETNMKNCSLNNVSGLNDINIIKCDLSDCKLAETDIVIGQIVESNISNLVLKSINSKLISKSNLSGCKLLNIDFKGFKFEFCNITNISIDGSIFENVTFEKCKIKAYFKKNNNLQGCTFISCEFIGAMLEEIDFNSNSNLLTSTFTNCVLNNIDLRGVKDLSTFKGTKFYSCLFNFNEFTNKSIERVQFHNINLFEQDLTQFTFTKSFFTNFQGNVPYFGLLSSIIYICDSSISSELINNTNSQYIPKLLYRGSRDGFKSKNFHSKCDNQGPTLTIIKSEHDQIFGAFTTQSWKSESRYASDDFAFIFKIVKDSNNGNYQFLKFPIRQDQKHQAICLHKDYMPSFGGGHDIRICNDCNLNNDSNSNFGMSYELPTFGLFKFGSESAKSYLSGSHKFKVLEIEVFKIN